MKPTKLTYQEEQVYRDRVKMALEKENLWKSKDSIVRAGVLRMEFLINIKWTKIPTYFPSIEFSSTIGQTCYWKGDATETPEQAISILLDRKREIAISIMEKCLSV